MGISRLLGLTEEGVSNIRREISGRTVVELSATPVSLWRAVDDWAEDLSCLCVQRDSSSRRYERNEGYTVYGFQPGNSGFLGRPMTTVVVSNCGEQARVEAWVRVPFGVRVLSLSFWVPAELHLEIDRCVKAGYTFLADMGRKTVNDLLARLQRPPIEAREDLVSGSAFGG